MADTSGFSIKSTSKKAPNVSSGWIVMVLSGLIAVVIFFVATGQGAQKSSVLVAAHDIAPGDVVDASSFRVAQVNIDQSQLSRLIGSKDKGSYEGYIATGPISSGDLVNKTQLLAPTGDNRARAMSFPIPKERAVNGALKVGDRVDIIDEAPGDPKAPPVYVASNVQVLSISSGGGGGLAGSSSSSYVVTFEITSDQGLRLAQALKDGKVDFVRSTGADPLDLGDNSTPTTSTTVAPK